MDYEDLLEKGARAYEEKRDLDLALGFLEKAAELNHEDHRQYMIAGFIYQQEGKLEHAFRLFKMALKHNPRSSLAWMRMAECLFDLKEYEKALRVIRKAVELEPSNPKYLDLEGRILLMMDRFDEALETYRIALDKSPDSVEALVGAAWALMMVERPEEALSLNRKANSLSPENVEVEEQYRSLTSKS